MNKRIFTIFLSVVIIFACAIFSTADGLCGHCYNCGSEKNFVVDYEYINDFYHAERHWCLDCGYDQLAGVNIKKHSHINGCIYCGLTRLESPDNLSGRIIHSQSGDINALVIFFDEVTSADSYTIVVYGNNIYEPYHFIEISETSVWITEDEYEWFDPYGEYRIRVQAISGYQASLFSEPIVVCGS